MEQGQVHSSGYVRVPLPWEQPRRQANLVVAGSWALSGCFVAMTAASLAFRDFALSVFLAGALAILTCLAVGMHYIALQPWRRDATAARLLPLLATSRAAVFMAYAHGARNSYYALMAGLLVLFSTAPVLVHLVPPDGTWRGGSIRLLAPFIPILTLLPILTFAGKLVRKRRELGIGLAPDGLYHWSWLGCRFIDWDWIVGIHASPVSAPRIDLTLREPTLRPRNEEESWVTRLRVVRRPDNVPAAFLNVHPNVAYYALWFYRRHPELRPELATEAGLERIKQMDFPDVIAEVREHGDILTRAAALRRRYLGL
jgi:hypothetical protein